MRILKLVVSFSPGSILSFSSYLLDCKSFWQDPVCSVPCTVFKCTVLNCQHSLSAVYLGQTGQSLCKSINRHKSEIQKSVEERLNLPWYSALGLKCQYLKRSENWHWFFNGKNAKWRLGWELVELTFIARLDTITQTLIRTRALSHYSSIARRLSFLIACIVNYH